jgi:hypothetical protein
LSFRGNWILIPQHFVVIPQLSGGTAVIFPPALRPIPSYTQSMIQIPLSPDAYAATAKLLAEKQGIVLTGNEGTIVKMGVTASYKYAGGALSVAILEKPFFVTTEYCEEQIKNWFATAV